MIAMSRSICHTGSKKIALFLFLILFAAIGVSTLFSLAPNNSLPQQISSTQQRGQSFIYQEIIQETNARVVNIGIYVINIGDLSLATGTLKVDFYIWESWTGTWSNTSNNSSLPSFPQFELMNGQINTYNAYPSEQKMPGYNYIYYRVDATLSEPINLQDYPFDTHQLTIELEDMNNPITSLVYSANSSSNIDPSVTVPGWQIIGAPMVNVTNHIYNTTWGLPSSLVTKGDQTYSRFVFSTTIARPSGSAIFSILIPIAVILLLAILSFFIRVDDPQIWAARLGMNVVSILTAVAFHLTLTASLPALGYFTISDYIMVVVYIALVYGLALTVFLHAQKELGSNSTRVTLIDRLSAIIVTLSVVSALSYLIFVVR
jgi:hypothetical protein